MSALPARPPHSLPSVLLRTLAIFCVIAAASLVYGCLCLLLLPWRRLRIRLGNLYGWCIGVPCLRLAGLHMQVNNKERIAAYGPALFVNNHTSTLDMWMVMALRLPGVCGVAKKEIVWVPFFGLAYLLSGHLLIDRGNRQRAFASLARAAAVVKRHRLGLWMWPEGTRSRDGVLRPLKKGFVHMAIATGLPLVPLVTHHGDLFWPHGSLRVRPGTFQVDVLEAIDTSGWRAETADQHAADVHAVLRAALSSRQRGAASADVEVVESTG